MSWLPDLCEAAAASSLHLTSTRPTPLLVEPREAATGHCAGGHWQLALKQQLLGGGSLVLPGLLGQSVLFVGASLTATTRCRSCCLLLLLLQFQRVKTRFSGKFGKKQMQAFLGLLFQWECVGVNTRNSSDYRNFFIFVLKFKNRFFCIKTPKFLIQEEKISPS